MAGSLHPFGWSALVTACLLAPGIASAQGAARPVTFSKDVAPIFQAKCQSCHEPGSIAPMSLASYKDRYVEELRTLIEAKVEGKEIVAPPEREAPHVINLMDALKKSVAAAKSNGRKETGGRKARGGAKKRRKSA